MNLQFDKPSMSSALDNCDAILSKARDLYDRAAQHDDPTLRSAALSILNSVRAIRKAIEE